MKFLIILLLIVSCASEQPKEPTTPKEPTVTKPNPNCIPVRDENGKDLGVSLTLKEHCNLQLQGSGFIDGQMYGYWTKNDKFKVDCSHISSKISGTVKFRKENTKYGTGVKMWPLTPMKSIAVDNKVIPYGSDVFIEPLKGIKYEFEGKTYIHDGWVKAQDTGGAIKETHIDFFIGPQDNWAAAYKYIKQFPFVKSKSSARFKAKVNGRTLSLWSTFYYLPKYKSCE